MRISSKAPRRPGRKRGWTRLDVALLVALAGLLVALLLPLLTSVRESARRRQCVDHFPQIAAALLAYHNACGSLPPAAVWTAQGVGDMTELIRTDGQIKFLRVERPLELTRENWVHHRAAGRTARGHRPD